MPLGNRWIFLATTLGVACCAHAQFNIGSTDVPQSQIDAYAAPFFKLISAGMGSERVPSSETGSGWEAGAATILLPIPSGAPFQNADLSILPLFRLSGGMRYEGGEAGIRGMAWYDPRAGEIITYGADLAYSRPLSATAWSAGVQGGWDYLSFGSSYSYPYEGSSLVFEEQGNVSGNYTLVENDLGTGAFVEFQKAHWKFYLQSGPELTLANFRYLYTDSQSGENEETHSSQDLFGWRTEIGAGWHGFHVEAGYDSYLYFSLGWSWISS